MSNMWLYVDTEERYDWHLFTYPVPGLKIAAPEALLVRYAAMELEYNAIQEEISKLVNEQSPNFERHK